MTQSRLATPRTSTSQHNGVPEAHRPTWRSVSSNVGAAIELAMKAVKAERINAVFMVARCDM